MDWARREVREDVNVARRGKGRRPQEESHREVIRILVVDDEPDVRKSISRVLDSADHLNDVAGSVAEAVDALEADSYALVLADMNMPGGSGLDLLQQIGRWPDTAMIIITAEDDRRLAEAALEAGAYGYITKPFSANELLINVLNALRRRRLEIENRDHQERLGEMVRERTAELWKALQDVQHAERQLHVSWEETIQRLSIAAEFRDSETAQHIHRMSRYCELLAGWSGLDRERSEMIRTASIMHDVGKIGIPDSILLKPGPLTRDEYVLMQQHSEFGHRILAGTSSSLLDLAATIALTHHEQWDGKGYPNGLKGDEIPIEGRIAGVADVFDALMSDRIYRPAFDLPEAVRTMQAMRERKFDPTLLDLFLENLPELLKVREEEEAHPPISFPA